MDSPCIKQNVCKVLNIFQHGKYLVVYVLNNSETPIIYYKYNKFNPIRSSIFNFNKIVTDINIDSNILDS